MTDRDLFFATRHQAAHAVITAVLGRTAARISPVASLVEEDWGIAGARIEEVAAVCAAGFAVERLLGRTTDEAWSRCKDDRSLLATIVADRSGIALEDVDLTDLFYQGVETAEAILRTPSAAKATDTIASMLLNVYDAGQSELGGEDVGKIVIAILRSVGQDSPPVSP